MHHQVTTRLSWDWKPWGCPNHQRRSELSTSWASACGSNAPERNRATQTFVSLGFQLFILDISLQNVSSMFYMDNSVYCISYYTLVSMKHSHSIVRWVGIPSRRTNQCVWPLDLHSPCFRFDPATSAKIHYKSLSTGVKMKIGYLIPHIYHINIIWINMVYIHV